MKVRAKRNIIYKLKPFRAGDIFFAVEDAYLKKQIEAGFVEEVKEDAAVKTKATVHEAPKAGKKEENINVEVKEEAIPVEEHVCPICGKTFKTEAGLKRHITRVHGENK